MIDSELQVAEMAVIGGALIDNDTTLHSVIGSLELDDFEDKRCQAIYNAILSLVDKKTVVSIITVSEELKNMKKFKDVGGDRFLLECEDALPFIEEVKDYINIVKDRSLVRRFFETVKAIEFEYSTKEIKDLPGFVGEAERRIVNVTKTRRIADFRDIRKVLDSVVIRLDERAKIREENKGKRPAYLTGTSTGFSELDQLIGGFQKGDLIILAARPSVGKTALALNFASKAAHQGYPVGIFSLEMSAEQIALRLLSERARLTTNEIGLIPINSAKTGFSETGNDIIKDKTSIHSLNEAMRELAQEPIYIDDSSGMKLGDIEIKAKKLKNNCPNLGLIIIDYLGLINSSNRNSKGDRQQEIAEISRNLKGLAKELQIPILVLCQLSRNVESRSDHTPQLSDLRDSGAIEQDADQVFFIYRPDYYPEKGNSSTTSNQKTPPAENAKQPITDPSEVTLILQKNRNGKLGKIRFLFMKKYCHFDLVDYTHGE